ncbi:unnamed protein product [Ambrosiozyma monospora]|uniref:Unnamed protein product n=1 Tax=Ambrosiozyma monospora TaxID=43982 RepID=A0A9W6Z8E8_AMBMO|nr:unnamed protein product [Ambrosiozyma monospora]
MMSNGMIEIGSVCFNPVFVESLLKLDEFYRNVSQTKCFDGDGELLLLRSVELKFDTLITRFMSMVESIAVNKNTETKVITDDDDDEEEEDVEMTTEIFNTATAAGSATNEKQKQKQKGKEKEKEPLLDPVEVLADELYRGFEINQLRLFNVVSGMYLDGFKFDVNDMESESESESESEEEEEDDDDEVDDDEEEDDEEKEDDESETNNEKEKEKAKEKEKERAKEKDIIIPATTPTPTPTTPTTTPPTPTQCNFNLLFLKLLARISITLVELGYIELQDELDELMYGNYKWLLKQTETETETETQTQTQNQTQTQTQKQRVTTTRTTNTTNTTNTTINLPIPHFPDLIESFPNDGSTISVTHAATQEKEKENAQTQEKANEKANEKEESEQEQEEMGNDLQMIKSKQDHHWNLCQLTLLPMLDTRVKVCNCCGCKVYCGEMKMKMKNEKEKENEKEMKKGGKVRDDGKDGKVRDGGKGKGKGLREVVVEVCKVCLFCGGRFTCN